MKHLGLFEGIGGFSLAARWMGWETLAWCEWNEFGQKVLRHHFPEAEGFGDITKTDFKRYANRIDIVTGGFPCQPYSTAGKRLGKADDRHLWPEMLRAIREIAPTYVVGENVRGIVSWNGGMVFDEVQTDLENEGYEVIPFILPACAVGAPHRRDRVWFIAKNTRCNGRANGEHDEQICFGKFREFGSGSKERIFRKEIDQYASETKKQSCGRELLKQQMEGELRGFNSADTITNSDSRRQSREEYWQEESGWIAEKSVSNYWSNFPTQSPICGGDDGVSRELDGITFPKWRNESIKAFGNAIVPQVAYEIFKAIENTHKFTQNK
jgi:DNA (cytosine-5)-methyltransferase 1